MAGWLFADLFLVLFVVSLASLPTPLVPKARPRHVAPPVSLSLDKPVSFFLNVAPTLLQDPATQSQGDAQVLAALNGSLAQAGLSNRRAGVLLVFASGPSTGINQAISTAQSVIGLVRSRVPGFAAVAGQGYWNGDGNGLKFEVFFFSAPSA